MATKSTHKAKARVMSANDVWEDAQEIALLIKKNLQKSDPVVKLQVPLSMFMSAVENLNREELLMLSRRIDEKLAV